MGTRRFFKLGAKGGVLFHVDNGPSGPFRISLSRIPFGSGHPFIKSSLHSSKFLSSCFNHPCFFFGVAFYLPTKIAATVPMLPWKFFFGLPLRVDTCNSTLAFDAGSLPSEKRFLPKGWVTKFSKPIDKKPWKSLPSWKNTKGGSCWIMIHPYLTKWWFIHQHIKIWWLDFQGIYRSWFYDLLRVNWCFVGWCYLWNLCWNGNSWSSKNSGVTLISPGYKGRCLWAYFFCDSAAAKRFQGTTCC